MIGTETIEVGGTRLVLRGDRTAYLPDPDTLLLADLHLGKAETFQAHGLAVPTGTESRDLENLSRAAKETGAARVIILGDMAHARAGLTESVIARFAAWRATMPAELILIRGNHDRALEHVPKSWRLTVIEDQLRLGSLILRHHPEPSPDGHVIAGHLHPMVRLGQSRVDRLRLPCFAVTDAMTILPAFTRLAGGTTVRCDEHTRCYAIANGDVQELFGSRMATRETCRNSGSSGK